VPCLALFSVPGAQDDHEQNEQDEHEGGGLVITAYGILARIVGLRVHGRHLGVFRVGGIVRRAHLSSVFGASDIGFHGSPSRLDDGGCSTATAYVRESDTACAFVGFASGHGTQKG